MVQGFIKLLIGWCLLTTGLGIIGWTLYASSQVFMAKKAAPVVFQAEKTSSESAAPSQKLSLNPQDWQKLLQQQLQEQTQELLPPEFLPQLLNLISWSVFAGILIFGGGKVAGLGIQLLRSDKSA